LNLLSYSSQAHSINLILIQKFNAYLKAAESSVTSRERLLLLELKRIDEYLESKGTTFLSGNEMTLVDCDVMPKLQHIRIAGKVGKKIPTSEINKKITNNYSKRLIETSKYQKSLFICGNIWLIVTIQKLLKNHALMIKI